MAGAGRSSFTVDGQPWELATGQALWLPAGASHAFTVHANSVLLPLHFEADQLAASVHTSARTVERAFRAETGMTLRRWRFLNRMEAAAEP